MSTKGRRSLTLGTRIFLMTATLIGLSVGAAVVVTTIVGQRIADEAIQEALSKSTSAQARFQLQRAEQLRLISRVFGSDPYLIAYLAEATENRDTLSMLDLLEERQAELEFDFAITLDPEGRVVVRTDQPEAVAEDLAGRSLVAVALDEGEALGVWRDGDRLYNAVAVPLVQDFVLQGFMITGFAIDDELAREVRSIGTAEIAYLMSSPSGAEVVAATLDAAAAEQMVLALRTQGSLRDVLGAGGQRQVEIAGKPWMAQLAPLRDALGETVGATVALVSLQEQRQTFRQIAGVLLAVGLVSMLLAFALSFALSRRSMLPVRNLMTAAEAARRGDYDANLDVKRSDEVGRLAAAFKSLLSELREKRDMQTYVSSLSRNLPDPAPRQVLSQPQSVEATLLGVELRRLANPRVNQDPPSTMERLTKDLRRVRGAVQGANGSFEAFFGHRLYSSFEGADRTYRALVAATKVMQVLSQRESAFDEIEPPAVALTCGQVVLGSVAASDQPERTLAGLAVQQLDGLLREASPGDIVLSQQCHKEVAEAIQRSGIELSPQRGLLSTQPLFLLNSDLASQVTGQVAGQAASGSVLEPAAGGSTLSDFGPGSVLGDRYEILSVLGAGGMGVVYKSRDRELGDLVALKMLRSEGRLELDNLKQELRLARRITHPNVLRTYDFGEIDGVPFISMEYVRGLTLRYLLDQTGRLPFSAGLRLGRQLCAGLGAAHSEQVLHRDIKPENIILDPSGDARIMDFGIAQPIARATPDGKTQQNLLVGTPHYLAPEQLRGQVPDTRADIYAVGMVLYEVFTGRLPFSGKSPMEIVQQHLSREPTPPSTAWPGIPAPLEQAILRCLAKEPAKRYQGVEELASVLATLQG